jgi:hypothetical protein
LAGHIDLTFGMAAGALTQVRTGQFKAYVNV